MKYHVLMDKEFITDNKFKNNLKYLLIKNQLNCKLSKGKILMVNILLTKISIQNFRLL